MQSINDIAVGYGQQVEALLERLGARGPVRGAGELLDQVKHLLDLRGRRTVGRFLKLRNRVIHGRPVEMPMPSREEVERAGRAAVAVLEGALAARACAGTTGATDATFCPSQESERQEDGSTGKRFEEPPGPVYRIRERDGAYEVWVGPGGVWVVAGTREALERARLDTEVRLVTRFPRLPVKAARRADGVEARIRWGRPRLSPEQIALAVRLLTQPPGADEPPSRPSAAPQGSAHRLRRVALEGIPATFYVGPAGVLAVAEHPLIAEAEARRVWEGSSGALSAIPAVLDPRLKEPEGRVGGVMALRDEGAVQDYLRGGRLLDDDEVDMVAGWLRNRSCPVPSIRPKGGRYRLREEEVTEGRTKAPPAFVVELVPPGAPPRPHLGQVAWRTLGWRVVFLPELAMFVLLALDKRGAESLLLWLLVGGLLLRFWASFGNDDLLGWKRRVLLAAGVLELAFVWTAMSDVAAHPGKLLSMWYWVVILVPGLISLFRGIWLFWSGRKPFRVYFPPRSRVR